MPRSRAFDAVVFDFDGTLVDSNAVKDAYFLEIAADFPDGKDWMERIRAVPGIDRFEVFRRFCDRVDVGVTTARDLAERYSRATDERVASAPEMPGAEALLAALRASNLPAFLSSATPLASLSAIVIRRGWARWFAGLHGRPADKLDTLRSVSASTGVKEPARIAVVGDGLDDLQSARTFGCPFFGVGRREALAAETPLLSLDEVGRRLLQDEETNR